MRLKINGKPVGGPVYVLIEVSTDHFDTKLYEEMSSIVTLATFEASFADDNKVEFDGYIADIVPNVEKGELKGAKYLLAATRWHHPDCEKTDCKKRKRSKRSIIRWKHVREYVQKLLAGDCEGKEAPE